MSTRRVDSRISGPLISSPSWAPRPVPTSSAVGVARPSAHGQAMISTATAAVKANARSSPAPIQKPSVATAIAITTGTKTPETRSASRCTGALPDCASVTRRAIWASAVSAPTFVARTTRRPPALTLAPATSSPGCFSTGTDSPVSSDWSTAEVPASTTPSVATFSPGRTTKRSPAASCSTGTRRSRPVGAEQRDVLGAELQQRGQRRAGAALGARLEVAAGEQEDGHRGGDLEVDLVGAGAALRQQVEAHLHAGHAGLADEQRVQRPAERGEHAEGDQRVHRRRRVTQVHPRGAVERPRAPDDDRRGERQRQPLPALELQRRDHRHREHGQRQRQRDEQPLPQRGGLVLRLGLGRRRVGQRGGVARGLDGLDQLCRLDRGRVVGHGRALRGVVDGGRDAVERVELALDPVRARRAGHARDRQLEVLGGHQRTSCVKATVCTAPSCWNWRNRR